MAQKHGLWGHLPLLVRANSKESVEYILQALWRTRKTGLDAADRQVLRQMLQLQTDNELDPVCSISSSLYTYIALQFLG
jgi:COMM domain containing 9